MKFSMQMSIDFYQFNEASLALESDDPGQAESFGELLLLTCFALRLLLTLGDSDGGYALAMSLFDVADNLVATNKLVATNVPRIVAKQEMPGQRQFSLKLVHAKKRCNFKMSTKGFRFLRSDLDLYAISALLLYIKYLVEQNSGKPNYLERLVEIIGKCAQVFVTRQLTRKTEQRLALTIVGLI